ncbi:type I restriction enzyme HsdR N-terminal domain-containing protein [Palaeococcus sp. (in: euryarchaeotes)]
MEHIEESIIRVLEKIKQHRRLYEANEEAVKQHLIGEIFQSLGWDIYNPNEVRPEERTDEGRADYALILDEKIVSFVEAKNLSVNVLKREKPLRQLGKYCFSQGVMYGILTNGLQWISIKAFEEGSTLRDRVLFTVDLEKEPLKKSALKLSLLGRDRIKDIEKISRLLNYMEKSFRELKRAGFSADMLFEYLKSSITLPDDFISKFVLLSMASPERTPRRFYIHDGSWKKLPLKEESWSGVITALLEYIVENKELKEEEVKELAALYKYSEKIPKDRILPLLRSIEEHFGIKIGFEF